VTAIAALDLGVIVGKTIKAETVAAALGTVKLDPQLELQRT
jgi:hypothetical protein